MGVTLSETRKKKRLMLLHRRWVGSAQSTGICVFLYLAPWCSLAVKTLGLGASVSSIHPRPAGQITTKLVPEKHLA